MNNSIIKENILTWLKIIASKEEQLNYEREAAGEIAGDEIVENWFSAYYPEDQAIKALFSDSERDSLNRFHQEFDSAASNLPTKLSDLHQNQKWHQIMANAQEVLQKCQWS